MLNENNNQKLLAVNIAQKVNPAEASALKLWLSNLLELREVKMSKVEKAKRALAITLKSNIIWPMLKIIAREIKSFGWDKRSSAQRLGLGGAAIGLTFFSGSSAGIAALGGAVGVPLWIVFGAGSMFATYLYEELVKSPKQQTDEAAYTTIEIKPNDPSQ